MDLVDNLLKKFIKLLEFILIAAIVVMVVVMFMQVVLRYVFSTGVAWSEELARFLMIYMIFLGSVVLTSGDAHIRVTIFDGMLKGLSLKILTAVQYFFSLVYCVLVSKIGFSTLGIVAKQKSPNMQITMDKVYVIIPVGCTLMCLYIVAKMVRLFMNNQPKEATE